MTNLRSSLQITQSLCKDCQQPCMIRAERTTFYENIFRAAADQGHPEASFNLAVGHMHGSKTDLKKG